jgi:outer membrane protein OmpA-like peptidoglycan-associated protein
MGPDALSIDRIRVVKPFNRVIMSADQVLNVSAVFDPQGTAAVLAARQAAEAAKAAEPARKKSRAELRAEKKAEEAAAKARAAAPPPPAPDLKETGMPIRIRELRVEGGQMDFADLSIKPSFAANITGLNGTVTGMSSDPKARAKVDFKGRVGEFSPVTIAGELQPFAYERYTDIGMKFENISLPIFNPYSGKFAGYSIAKGKLTTDLHYTVQDRKLDAKHHIRIDQLEWGPATAEKTEATLPVKFATSLLKDADGVINLDIPVTGTLDDPKFRIGPIVWQIIRNILTKAITAPFRALGALFKDAEESQFVDFAPGAATLDPATAERLGGLAKALAAKSDIRLNVPIATLPELDQVALVDQRFAAARDAAVRKVVYGKKAADDKPLPAFESLDADKRIEALTAVVQQLSGAAPQVPPPPTPPEGAPRKDARALADSATLEFLEKDARSRLAPSATELDALGQQRAEVVQRALLADTGLAPDRVFLVKNGKVAAQDGKVRLELAME